MKYTKEKLEEAVINSKSIADVIRFFGKKIAGGTHSHIAKKINMYNIDTSHFMGQASNLGKSFPSLRKTKEEILTFNESVYRPKTHQLKRAMLESNVDYNCGLCLNNGIWNSKELILQVDHIDGNWNNNQIDNLRFLCPNCHSQTCNFGSKNK